MSLLVTRVLSCVGLFICSNCSIVLMLIAACAGEIGIHGHGACHGGCLDAATPAVRIVGDSGSSWQTVLSQICCVPVSAA